MKKNIKYLVVFIIIIGVYFFNKHTEITEVVYVSEATVLVDKDNYKIKFYRELRTSKLFILSHKGDKIFIEDLKLEKQ